MSDAPNTRYDPHAIEARRQAAWRERAAFATPSVEGDGPRRYIKPSAPFTSGNIHIGHVRSYSIGDAYARFQRARGEDPSLVDALLSADERRRSAVSRADNLRAEQKRLGKQVGKSKGEEWETLLAQARQLAADVKEAEAEQNAAEEELLQVHKQIPNVVEPETPSGGEDDFVVLKHVGTPRAFDFQYGANRPEKAGTMYRPPLSSTDCASSSTSGAALISLRLSRSHCTSAPVIAIAPSRQ